MDRYIEELAIRRDRLEEQLVEVEARLAEARAACDHEPEDEGSAWCQHCGGYVARFAISRR